MAEPIQVGDRFLKPTGEDVVVVLVEGDRAVMQQYNADGSISFYPVDVADLQEVKDQVS